MVLTTDATGLGDVHILVGFPATLGYFDRHTSWVKPKRRKRSAQRNHGRRRDEKPTRTVQHAYERCPECNCRLQGGSTDHTRQVVELPPPQAREVIEHQASP